MIAFPSGVRVWLATGHTDMRKGFDGLSLLVQETLKRDPHDGHLFVFRGRRGDLIKVVWHDGQGMCLFSKRLERGRFLWPSVADGTVTISSAQLGYLLDGRSRLRLRQAKPDGEPVEGRLAGAPEDVAAARRGIVQYKLCIAATVAPKRTTSMILFLGEHAL